MRNPWISRALVLFVLGAPTGLLSSPTTEVRSPIVCPPPATVRPYQVGVASWYGSEFQGRETTSGERFNMNAFTAAHRELPLGSWVRVTNLCNSRSVVLKVNDRGPVTHKRIIDVSYAVARALRFKGAGLASVRLDLLARR